jgi:hypothetical protein
MTVKEIMEPGRATAPALSLPHNRSYENSSARTNSLVICVFNHKFRIILLTEFFTLCK